MVNTNTVYSLINGILLISVVTQCSWPGPLYNGYILGQNTRVGSVLFFSCNTRTTFDGVSFETTCLENGQWSSPVPTCWSQCQVPSIEDAILVEGRQVGEWINHGHNIGYTCRIISDDSTTINVASCYNGTWDNITQCMSATTSGQCTYKLYPNTAIEITGLAQSSAPSTVDQCLGYCSDDSLCGGILFRNGYECTELPRYSDFLLTTPNDGTLFYRRMCEACDTIFDFQCQSGGCLHFRQVCDYIVDCDDSSDESNCGETISLSEGSKGIVSVVRNNISFLVCDHDRWNDFDAKVICRLAGFSGGISHTSIRIPEPALWIRTLDCNGDEESLDNCNIDREPFCVTQSAVRVECSTLTFPPPS